MPIVDLNTKTIREIHQAIIATTSINAAAHKLGVTNIALVNHLARFGYQKENQHAALTCFLMRKLWPSELEGATYWGDAYDKQMQLPKVNISKKTVREIHQAILQSSSLFNAASLLSVDKRKLTNYLKKVNYRDQNNQAQILNYNLIRINWPDEAAGLAQWGDAYDQPFQLNNSQSNSNTLATPADDQAIQPARIDISAKTLREVHQAILSSTSLFDAASRLGITSTQLKNHLRNYRYEGSQKLSYTNMKKDLSSEQEGAAYWKDIYDQTIQKDKCDLSKKTIREIHRAILVSNSLSDATLRLGVVNATLQVHLAKFRYLDANDNLKILTFESMKTIWPNEAAGLQGWGEAYDQPMQAPNVSLTDFTIREIHKIILASRSQQDAASQLAVTHFTLQKYLGSYLNENNQHEPLTYEIIKTNWPNETAGLQKWGEAYDQPMQTVKVNLSKKTIREIHKSVLISSSLKNAAALLGVNIVTLRAHLTCFKYHDENNTLQDLTYAAMKKMWPNEHQGQAYWQTAYDQPMQAPENDISNKTIKQIHHAILASKSLSDAAGRLGVTSNTLKTLLGGFKYQDKNNQTKCMTYKTMKTNWPNEAAGFQQWQDNYDKPMRSTKASFNTKTLREIHQTILASKTLSDAAAELGVHAATLKNHLRQCQYRDANDEQHFLTYEIMKTLLPTAAIGSAYWGPAYDECIQSKSVHYLKKTLKEIHQVILASSSLQDAASRLRITDKTLCVHLNKFIYLDANNQQQRLNYIAMKTNWPTVEMGLAYWGTAYEKVTRATKFTIFNRTVREIHQAILATDTAFDAASELGIWDSTLKKHLNNFSYRDANNELIPLTYEAMKTIWPNEQQGAAYWQANYDQPFEITEEELDSELEVEAESDADLALEIVEARYISSSTVVIPGSPSNNGLFSQSRKRSATQLTATTEKLFEEVVLIIQETSSEDEAASRLGTTAELLRNDLLQVNLTYDDIKENTPLFNIIQNTETNSIIVISTSPKRIAPLLHN